MDIDYDFHKHFVERGEWWEVVDRHVRDTDGVVEVMFVDRYRIEDRDEAVAASVGGGYAKSIGDDYGICMSSELYHAKLLDTTDWVDISGSEDWGSGDWLLLGPRVKLTPCPPTAEERKAAMRGWR